jgi:Trypsin-like peptidase domain
VEGGGDRLRRRFFRAALALCLALVSRTATSQVDKLFLNSTVLITYTVTSPGPASAETSPGATNRPAQELGVVHGTGFLLFGDVGFSKAKVYLITNRHLLPPEGHAKDIQLRLVVRENDGAAKIEEISVPIVGKDGKYLPSVRLHPDPATDVAAVNIATAAFGAKFQSLIEAIKTGKYLNSSMLLPTKKMSAEGIGVGSQVYVLGFPAAIFDPRNVSPVLRVGVISTDPQDGFNFNQELRRTQNFPEHIDGFLLDANIYPGSSGSLVVQATENHGCSNKDAAPHQYILGIVSGSIPIFDASLHSYSRIGLGMVYSADTIREVLEGFSH